ncbi:MAG: hypothetical protein U1F83_08210 [Verrucomicrobiota bacterium]
MTIFGQISSGPSEPERVVAILAVFGLLGFVIWQGVKWILQTKPAADPWDETTTAELEGDEAVPLCHHCLLPHDVSTDFCPGCGTPVGQYTNWLPFPQLFSVGHVLRTGTSGEFKRTPLTILGFLLFSLVEYTLFVPIYWIVFLRKTLGHRNPEVPPPTAATTQ